MSKLAAFLGRAIPTHQKKQSSHLGDRTVYVGASDIAGCPRKAALGKQSPEHHDIATLLRFSRGHAAQAMYAEFFTTGGALFNEEVEVKHPQFPEIRCHIDFLFYANRLTKRLHIVEMKSTDGIPDEPYASWVDQLHVQMGLLQLTLDPEVQIGGSILVVDLNAGRRRLFRWHIQDGVVRLGRFSGLIFFHGVDDHLQLFNGEPAAYLGVTIFRVFKVAIPKMIVNHFGKGRHVEHASVGFFHCYHRHDLK